MGTSPLSFARAPAGHHPPLGGRIGMIRCSSDQRTVRERLEALEKGKLAELRR
jgi:hypothetical protein